MSRAAITGGWRSPVGESPDLDRILRLERRVPPDLARDGPAYVEHALQRYGRGPRACRCASLKRPCILRPFAVQAWALHEMAVAGGLLGNLAVGCGKSGLDLLAPMAVPGCKQAVVFVPPSLREQLKLEYLAWAEHFHVPSIVCGDWGNVIPGRPVLHVISWSALSQQSSTDLLERMRPDLIIADEAHSVKHRATARARRFLRYFLQHPDVRLCAWSGTLTARSILDFVHLSMLALREGSPLPLNAVVAEEWALAIDPSEWPAPAGALRRLARPDEGIHSAFNRRLVETRGVVATTASAAPMSLNILERKPKPPPAEVEKLLGYLRRDWVRPDGEELREILEVTATAKQLACGMYYRWKFPRGEPEELIERWFKARREWHRELRAKLARHAEHLDSEGLVTNAAARAWRGDASTRKLGETWHRADGMPMWKALKWPAWAEVKDLVEPEPDTVWVDDWLAHDAAEWAQSHRGVVWYKYRSFGARVAELAGVPMHGGGPGAEARILAERGDRSICASVKAHGTGRNGLQFLYSEQLIANSFSDAAEIEQVLGRLHREGQKADEVTAWVYRHTAELRAAIDSAVRKAKYVASTWGAHQKLLAASTDFPLTEDEAPEGESSDDFGDPEAADDLLGEFLPGRP